MFSTVRFIEGETWIRQVYFVKKLNNSVTDSAISENVFVFKTDSRLTDSIF